MSYSPKHLKNRIIVIQDNASTILGGVILSDKEYFIDGIIDCSGFSIEIPSGGINIKGYDFDISKLICSDINYTMFTSPVGGSGNVLFSDFAIEVTGATSKVYDIVSDTGFEAIEVTRINYNDCTSLGIVDNYRQGLETGTGRFGGTPELTLKGVWVGGYFIDTSIVRSLTDGSYTLYKAGVGFLMSSRFRSNQNIDLPALASFLDFSDSNFVNPSTLQLKGCLMSRNGVIDSSDSNLTPNITEKEVSSDWDGNVGLNNTFIGGTKTVSTEIETVIALINTPTIILGTFTATDLQHFENNLNYSMKMLGTDPLDYKITFDFVLKGTGSEEYQVNLMRDRGGVITTQYSQLRTIDRLVAGVDVTYFTGTFGVSMQQNDFVYWEVENVSSGNNCTLASSSQWIIEER